MRFICFLLFVAIAACSTLPEEAYVTGGPCENDIAILDADFSGAGMYSCAVGRDGRFHVRIAPEKEPPINPSPWYAVRLTPKQPGTAQVTLQYLHHKHRYLPKISTDAKNWEYLNFDKVKVGRGEKRASMSIDLQDKAKFLAGQELFLNADYEVILEKLDAAPDTVRTTIGQSIEGRNIDLITSKAGNGSNKYIMLVGRQHPPEVSGAHAMTVFVDTVMSDSDLARAFREQFNVMIIPNMNPDGVEHGYWRLNMGGIDLNRDWGPFTQPETQAVRSLLGELDKKEMQMLLFLDFHSTRRDVFYTQTKEDEPTSYDFTGQWLGNSQARLDNYEVERAERHNSDLPTSKNYIALTYNVPAITYELGDETDRTLLREATPVFAEEMMKLLLEHHSQ